jgi:hypothetical protein
MYSPANTTLLLVGDLTVAEARRIAQQALGSWHGAAVQLPAVSNPVQPAQGTRVILVDRPGSVQSGVWVGQAGMGYGDPTTSHGRALERAGRRLQGPHQHEPARAPRLDLRRLHQLQPAAPGWAPSPSPAPCAPTPPTRPWPRRCASTAASPPSRCPAEELQSRWPTWWGASPTPCRRCRGWPGGWRRCCLRAAAGLLVHLPRAGGAGDGRRHRPGGASRSSSPTRSPSWWRATSPRSRRRSARSTWARWRSGTPLGNKVR